MKKYIATMDAYYIGTDETLFLIADNSEQVEAYVAEKFENHKQEHEYLCESDFESEMEENYGEDWEYELDDRDDAFYSSQAYLDYSDGCEWEVHEATEQEIEDYADEEWQDLTKGD